MTTSTDVQVKERPILFSGAMVRAILEGRKTQTRRVVNLPPNEDWHLWSSTFEEDVEFTDAPKTAYSEIVSRCSVRNKYGKPGDRLWVRETWIPVRHGSYEAFDRRFKPRSQYDAVIQFAADPIHGYQHSCDSYAGQWRPSIFMPRWACRIHLEITMVRSERLQDITREDVRAEGIPETWGNGAIGLRFPGLEPHEWDNLRWNEQWRKCWDSINAKRGFGWDANPWVWVIEFRRVQ